MSFWEHFPYTNFHELNLEWILETVKTYVNKTDSLSIRVTEIKNYVENYFDNLDLRAEVSEYIDTLIENGTIGEIIFDKVGYVTPQMFGAVADGVTDDTNAILTCINSAVSTFLPVGKYKISDTIRVRSGVTIKGANSKTCVLLPVGMENRPIISNNINIGSGDTTVLKDVVLEKFGISFVSDNRTDYIIKLVNPVECTLKEVYVINGSRMLTAYSAIYLGSENYHVQPSWTNRIENCHLHMVKLVFKWCSDNWVCGNYFNNILNEVCLDFDHASGSMISNNQIIGELKFVESEYLLITNNYFDGGGAHDTGAMFNGLYFSGTTTNSIISANRFYQISKCAIYMSGTLNNIAIDSCTFEDCDCYNNGFDDVAIYVNGVVPPNITIDNCKHRHVTYWKIENGVTTSHDRTALTNNGRPYLVRGVSDPITNLQNYNYIVISKANLFQASFYESAEADGGVKFVSCTPSFRFPNGYSGFAVLDSGISNLNFTVTDDTVVSQHVNFKLAFTTPPAVTLNFLSNVALNYFAFGVTNITNTGFDVTMQRLKDNLTGEFDVNVSWIACSP